MAAYDLELEMVGCFLKAAKENDKRAWKVLDIVRPPMIEDTDLRSRLTLYTERFSLGDIVEDPEDDPDYVWQELHTSFDTEHLIDYAQRLRNDYRNRVMVQLLNVGVAEAYRALGSTNGKAKTIADRLSMALLELFAESGDSSRPQTFVEILDNELALMNVPDDPGVSVPYARLELNCGPWLAGDVIAVTAYSNAGKSTFVANLALRFARRGQPCLVFPSEMRELWVARALAADSGVAQRIVEKRQWNKLATQDDRDSYIAAVERSRAFPLEIVNRSDISPTEIIAATRVIRKRWKGQPVVVIVDHMHRLRYDDDPNKCVGLATKLLRNFAAQDNEGGLIFVLLYQPRKPHTEVYAPIAAHEIRGDSTVWNEIDVCLSPYRHWVKTDPNKSATAMGTAATALDANGHIMFTKPNTAGAKVCDEHFLMKIDKRRVGGEGPTITLNFDAPSGLIYETYGPHGERRDEV